MKNQNHTSHFTHRTSQKGITLIALIITIIVMLILVGVTINVALNGGLFTKASEASEQMQIEAEKEELLSAVVAAIGTDGKVSIPYLDDNLPEGWSGEDGTYTSPKGNTFTVDENGKITGGENKLDTDYYGYYKTNATSGSVEFEVGYYIADQSYYIGDLYKIEKNEYKDEKNGYNLGECSMIVTMGNEGLLAPIMYGYVENDYTALLEDGTTKKYENAIFVKALGSDKKDYLQGYFKNENGQYKLVLIGSIFSDENTNIGEDGKIIKYTSLEEAGGLNKSFLPSNNVDEVYEYDVGEGYKLLCARSGNNIMEGINMAGQDFYMSRDNATLKDTYTLKLKDGVIKEYKNAVVTIQDDGDEHLCGYFKDDNTFVKVGNSYAFDDNGQYWDIVGENVYTKR